jgi:hypothetical protein
MTNDPEAFYAKRSRSQGNLLRFPPVTVGREKAAGVRGWVLSSDRGVVRACPRSTKAMPEPLKTLHRLDRLARSRKINRGWVCARRS